MLLYANEWLLTYTGESIESLNKNRWERVVHKDDYDSFSVLFNSDAIRGSTVVKNQSRLKNRAGEYLWHQVSLSPFRDEKNELQYWIGYIVDIHKQKIFEQTLQDNIELKQTQEQLKKNQQTLETYIHELNRSNEELQQFAFIASHDLQEPVRKLLFYCDYLLSRYHDSLDKKGIDYLSSMQKASQRMRSLIQDLLVFSQIKKEEISFREVDLNEVASEACQDFEIAIEEKNASLTIQPLPRINGDKRMMRQLFDNLISNSLKYCRKENTPDINISSKENGNFIELAFRDNGIGFDEKYLPQMFTLFQRLHNRSDYEGTGLGLAICRRIVELHQGKIWAEAIEGEGATFYVSLPLYPAVHQP